MKPWMLELRSLVGAAVEFDAPMKPRVSLRTGGRADALVRAGSIDCLKALLAFARREGIPYTVLGAGSNVLVSDRGIRGLTIHLAGELARVQAAAVDDCDKRPVLRVGAGTRNAALVKTALHLGLEGFEFLAAIPGTLGGAVVTNAGAFGASVDQCVVSITVLNPSGRLEEKMAGDCNFGYRRCGLQPGDVVVAATLRAAYGSREHSQRVICQNHSMRLATQPIRLPNAGSVFLNPPGHFAAGLIEYCGMKGRRHGDAAVSDQHANFIVNLGGATSSHVFELAESVRQRVRSRCHVELHWEVRTVGSWRIPV